MGWVSCRGVPRSRLRGLGTYKSNVARQVSLGLQELSDLDFSLNFSLFQALKFYIGKYVNFSQPQFPGL